MRLFVRIRRNASHSGYMISMAHKDPNCKQITKIAKRHDAVIGHIVEIKGEIADYLDVCSRCDK